MTSEQVALLTKARRSLAAAKKLKDYGDYDFAVSRAYYAMFYVARALLFGKGLSFSSHAAVNAAFGQHFAKTGFIDPRFHRYLIDAEETRIEGDYMAHVRLGEAEAAEEIAHAEEFLAAAEPLLRGDNQETSP